MGRVSMCVYDERGGVCCGEGAYLSKWYVEGFLNVASDDIVAVLFFATQAMWVGSGRKQGWWRVKGSLKLRSRSGDGGGLGKQ